MLAWKHAECSGCHQATEICSTTDMQADGIDLSQHPELRVPVSECTATTVLATGGFLRRVIRRNQDSGTISVAPDPLFSFFFLTLSSMGAEHFDLHPSCRRLFLTCILPEHFDLHPDLHPSFLQINS